MNKFLQRTSAIVLVSAGIIFAAVAILAIWEVTDNTKITWKALGTLAMIALASLIVNIGSKIYQQTSRR